MGKKKKENKINCWYGVLTLPVIFVLMVVGYLWLNKFAERNRRVCTFLGKVWLVGVPSDPSVKHGCFTYEEIYE